MFYRWIVIENSLKDKSVLKQYPLLSETIFAANNPERKSRMLKLRVPENEVDELVDSLKMNIIAPYYTNFYNEDSTNDSLIIIFSDQKFYTKKTSYQDAIDYGLTHGVSEIEMQISPVDVGKEEW